MGVLDEAIREHLDLKRRRGADPAEIERAEREALGPVRRNRDPAAGEEPEPIDEDAGEEELVGSAYDEPDDSVAGDIAEQRPVAPEDVTAVVPEPTGLAFAGEDQSFAEETAADEPEPPLEDDAPATRVMRTTDLPALSDMTAEYDVEEALAAEAGAEDEDGTPEDERDEDVLEETPEFLQDTPDHDRLWFEQRPPRDFDFDG